VNELVASMVVILVSVAVGLPLIHRFPREDHQLLKGSLLLHMIASVSLVLLYTAYYAAEGGDILNYHRNGVLLADAVWEDPIPRTWQLVLALFQQPSQLPFPLFGGQSGTGTMSAVTSLLMMFMGNSLYGACLALGFASFVGKLWLFDAFASTLPASYRKRILVATMLVPSVVFWSAGLMKESFALLGVCFVVAGVRRVIRGEIYAALTALFGAVLIGLIKPYILLPAVMASAVWFYADKAIDPKQGFTFQPGYLVLGAIGGVVGYLAAASIFPEFAITSVADSAATRRELSFGDGGGSVYSLGDTSNRTLSGQIIYAPAALITTLFRPTLLEVRNPLMLISALETTVLTVLLVSSLWKRRLRSIYTSVVRSPVLLFCLAFTLLLSVGIGLGTTNFGTLSRYRIPVMPFFATLVMVWSGTEGVAAVAASKAAGAPDTSPVPGRRRSSPAAPGPRRRPRPRPVVAG
jgi:hypothetical protein